MCDPKTDDLGATLTALLQGKLSQDAELAVAERALEWAIPKAQMALAAIKLWRSYGAGGPFAPAPRNTTPITEGQPWAGPQPVDNPSGAIGGPNLSPRR